MRDIAKEREVEYRVRHHIYTNLEVAASIEEQRLWELRLHEARAPGIVPSEVLCGWEDAYFPDKPDLYKLPVYSCEELEAIRKYHQVWSSVCENLPAALGSEVDDVAELPIWIELMSAAAKALAVFKVRGPMIELAYPDMDLSG